MAETAPPRSALVGLARQFVDRVGGGFEEADRYLLDLDPEEKRRRSFATDIPDGELLLLQVRVGDREKGVTFEEPVIAIKQGDDVMVSLGDFFSVAQFAIEVRPMEGVAEGWYIRQNQKFRLDVKAGTAVAQERVYLLKEGDVAVEETDILMRGAVLEELFGFESEVLLSRLAMLVEETEQKWPAVEKLERLRRRDRFGLPPPALPRQEEPYKTASVPNIDISTSRGFERSGEGAIGHTADYNLVAQGDLANHTARIIAAGGFLPEDNLLDTAKATFRRESDEPDLLSWMRAREYEFGDIGAGIGIRATNRNPYVTSGELTAIEGDVFPGWDVELYRGAQYLENITNSDGAYRFEDIELTPGANVFKIIKYGPLGEIEEEEVTVYSVPHLDEDGLYTVSVSAAQTDLWTRRTQHGQDKYTPVIDGNYEWRVGQATSMRAGLSTSQQQGQQKTFTRLGVASYLDGVSLNANVTADVDGSWTGSATARGKVLDQNASVGASYVAPDFGVISDQQTPSEYSVDGSLRGRVPGVAATYSFNTSYTESSDGVSQHSSRLGMGTRIRQVGVSTSLDHEIRRTPTSEAETLSGLTALNGRIGRTRWRASADYAIDPIWNVNSYFLNLSRGLAKDLSGQATLRYDPNRDFKSETLSLVWSGKYARVSPEITYDDARNFSALVNTSFGLAYNDYGGDIIMRGKDLAELGAVSAFVYLDKNGDRVFTAGADEPIQDAIVQALHSNTSAATDEAGEAFLYDLRANVITDVRVDENSFFDPFFVPGAPGVSILPRPGHEARVEFPVHNGGELDGTVYMRLPQGKERSLRNVRVHLYDADGKLAQTATTSFDGFYLFQKIHPGRYLLLVDEKDARNFGFIRPLPEEIVFGYEGTLVYGHDIIVARAGEEEKDVPLSIGADLADYAGLHPGLDPAAIGDAVIVLNFGDYNSRLMAALVWYRLKKHYGPVIGGARLLVPLAETNYSLETGLHTLRAAFPGTDLADARRRCRALAARGIYCGVEALPAGLPKEARAETADKG